MTTFDLYTPEEVIDSHPEFADMDNPNGYIYGFGIYLRATNELGQRWLGAKVGACRDLRGVDLFLRTWERPLERMTAHGAICGNWMPTEPKYGSPAYVMHEFVSPSEGYASNLPNA